MVRRIWKYQLSLRDADSAGIIRINIPEGGQFLTVHEQDEWVCMWVLVDEKQPYMLHSFFVAGTGQPLPADYRTENYLGTAHVPPFVWHVFGPL